jgi:hypothetical protein
MKVNLQIMIVFLIFLFLSSCNSVENYNTNYINYNQYTGEMINSRGNCRRNCLRGKTRRPSKFSNPFKKFKMPNFKNMFGKLFSFCTGGSTGGALCTLIGGKLFGVDFSSIIMIGVVLVIIYFVVLK